MATARNYRTLLNAIKKPTFTPAEYMNEMMQLTTDSSRKTAILPAKLYRNLIPDVKGMGLKDAVYMLEASGLHVQVRGKGKVQNQSLLPGTRISKGDSIILQLS
jgi:cell division protein FtsI (penicillin-binding protein 3)